MLGRQMPPNACRVLRRSGRNALDGGQTEGASNPKRSSCRCATRLYGEFFCAATFAVRDSRGRYVGLVLAFSQSHWVHCWVKVNGEPAIVVREQAH
jgi:hypothetical protein